MICDKEKCKGCGQWIMVTVENERSGEIKNIELCRFQAILDTLWNIDKGGIGIQAAVESQRNEEVKTGEKLATSLNIGFRELARATTDASKIKKIHAYDVVDGD